MSYMAEAIMKQNMSPEEYKRNVEGAPPQPQDTPAPTEAPAEAAKPSQLAAQEITPEGAANIEKERQRYRTAGYEQELRTLGGPLGRLGT